jgi:hypothetical protein
MMDVDRRKFTCCDSAAPPENRLILPILAQRLISLPLPLGSLLAAAKAAVVAHRFNFSGLFLPEERPGCFRNDIKIQYYQTKIVPITPAHRF